MPTWETDSTIPVEGPDIRVSKRNKVKILPANDMTTSSVFRWVWNGEFDVGLTYASPRRG